MFSKILPGVGRLANFFHDARRSSLYGNARNFMNVEMTYGLEMKEYIPQETKKAITKKHIRSVFLLVFNDTRNKVMTRSPDTGWDPIVLASV